MPDPLAVRHQLVEALSDETLTFEDVLRLLGDTASALGQDAKAHNYRILATRISHVVDYARAHRI